MAANWPIQFRVEGIGRLVLDDHFSFLPAAIVIDVDGLDFKERFGISPNEYSQMMRLNMVRRDLQTNSGRKTVTNVAMKWGFSDLLRKSCL